MDISLPALAGWVLPSLLAVGLLGAWPTWRWYGQAGFQAAGLAGLVVIPLLVLSALLTVSSAGKGPGWAAFTFASAGVARMIVSFILAGVILWTEPVPAIPMVGWTMGFYLAVLTAESIWLSRALQLHDHRQGLDGFDAPADPEVGP
jgi:hypothetical protein